MNINVNTAAPAAFFLWQRFIHAEVYRKNSELLQVDLYFLETSREDRLHVELYVKDYTIKQAVLERTRPVSGAIKPLNLLFLQGRSIYLKEAKTLKEAILNWGDTKAYNLSSAEIPDLPSIPEREHFADLFIELISNVLQSEIFLLPERGFSSIEEYDRFFSDLYNDTCILFRTPRAEMAVEEVYTQGQKRYASLFNRNKGVVVFRPEPGEESGEEAIMLHVYFNDSFHEIGLSLRVLPFSKPPCLIKKARGNFLRRPATLCMEAMAKLDDLTGVSLLPSEKKKIISLVNGPGGCSHLCDMVLDAAGALQEMQNSQFFL